MSIKVTSFDDVVLHGVIQNERNKYRRFRIRFIGSQTKTTAAILFWASWDGGSWSFTPIYEQVADENRYKLGFYKMDADTTQTTMTKIGVRSVPTVTLFKDGQLTGQIVGAVTKAKLSTLIDSI